MTDYSEKLRLDKRLLRRRGWIPRDELRRELDALPDASEKIRPPEEESEDTSASETPGTGG